VTRIYFDHNATTPVAPEVADAMANALRTIYGNPSSVHAYGQQAKTALDAARASVATLIGAEPTELVFTSGGSESDNLAVRGVADSSIASGRRHLVASAIEHEAVIQTLKALSKSGWTTTLVGVDASGIVSPDRLAEAVTEKTALVSIMHANNEIGAIQPVADLAAVAHAHGALFHTDAVQSVGKIPVDVSALGVDLLSLSAHKFNGPKGVGALWVRRGTRLRTQMTGGKQERNRRAGTENVPAMVGMGVAARLATAKVAAPNDHLASLRDRLEAGILSGVTGTESNGHADLRVDNTSNISFTGVEAESLLIALDLEGVAVSTGSACSSGTLEPSHVLRAMGFSPHRTQNSIRFSLGLGNTEAEVDYVVRALPGIVARLRGVSGRRPRTAVAAHS
jgi:cysteine desulfurase